MGNLQVLRLAAFGVLFAFLFSLFLHVNQSYPYYFLWDMDHVTALDAFLINNGRLPVHLNHPGFGMQLLMQGFLLISRVASPLSLYTWADIHESLNPILGWAQYTDYLRHWSPWVAISIVALLWAAVSEEALAFSVFTLLALASQSSLFFQASMIRSELYALLFWAVAFLFLIRAARKFSTVLLVGAGVFLGLAFLTKMQAVVYVFGAPLFFFLLRSPSSEVSRIRWLPYVNLFGAVCLLLGAYFQKAEGATFAESYAPSVLALAFMAFPSVLLWMDWKGRLSPIARPSHFIVSGFLLAFLLHFLMFLSPATSLTYLFLDAKMIFFRPTAYSNQVLVNDLNQGVITFFYTWKNFLPSIFRQLADEIHQAPIVFLANFAAALMAFRERRWLVASLWLAGIVNGMFCVRSISRDLLWLEVWLNVSTLVFLGLVWKARARPAPRAAVLAIICTLSISNIISSSKILTVLDGNYFAYGWRQERFFKGGNSFFPEHSSHRMFTILMTEGLSNPELRADLAKFSDNYLSWLRMAQFAFPNQALSLRDVGMVREGLKALREGQLRFSSVPEQFRGAVVVDNSKLPISNLNFDPSLMFELTDSWNKIVRSSEPDLLAVLPRSDLDVWLFQNKPAAQQPKIIVQGEKGETVELWGSRIEKFQSLPRATLGKISFFVVAPKGSKAEQD